MIASKPGPRRTALLVLAQAAGGSLCKLYWPAYRGSLYSVAGPVPLHVRVLLMYRGRAAVATRAWRRIRALGYRCGIKRDVRELLPLEESEPVPARYRLGASKRGRKPSAADGSETGFLFPEQGGVTGHAVASLVRN